MAAFSFFFGKFLLSRFPKLWIVYQVLKFFESKNTAAVAEFKAGIFGQEYPKPAIVMLNSKSDYPVIKMKDRQ